MAQTLATYTLSGECHRIELARVRDGALVLDHPAAGAPLVVAELSCEEGQAEALAVLHAGGYLERAAAGERGLGPTLSACDDREGAWTLQQAA